MQITEFEAHNRPAVLCLRHCDQVTEFFDALEKRGHPELADKAQSRLWGPYELPEDGRRSDKAVKELLLLSFDLDDCTTAQIEETQGRITELGLTALMHTTHSHAPDSVESFSEKLGRQAGGHRWRLLISIRHPLRAQVWKPHWLAAVAHVAPHADQQCKDISRCYYYPSKPPGSKVAAFWRNTGEPLDVLLLPKPKVAAEPSRATAARVISREVLQRLAKKWQRSSQGNLSDLGDRLQCCLDGTVYAEAGERDNITFRLAGELVRAFPDLDPHQVASEHFALSLALMRRKDPTATECTLAFVKDKLTRAKGANIAADATGATNSLALQRCGRDRPYSEAELDGIAEGLGISRQSLTTSWILQCANVFYLWEPVIQSYSLQSQASVRKAALVSLSPTDVELTRMTKAGNDRAVTLPELLEANSSVVNHVEHSWLVDYPELDWSSKTLTLPARSKRLEPAEDPAVHKWLQLLGGEKLLDWIAFCRDLDKPSCALVLIGEPGAGKSLLPRGLSRIWTTGGPASYAQVADRYGDALFKCPIVLADESLPKSNSGHVDHTAVREFVQCVERTVNKKYGPQVPLHGATRLILAANNDSIFETHGHQSAQDFAAVAERFFYIKAGKEAAEYLRLIGGRPFIEQEWIEKDALAKHLLWLFENRECVWSGRFGVENDSSDVGQRLRVRNGLRGPMCEFLVRAALSKSRSVDFVYEHGTGIWLDLQTVLDSWQAVMQTPKPATTLAGRVLQELSTSGIADLACVPLTDVMAWISETGFCAPDTLLKALDGYAES